MSKYILLMVLLMGGVVNNLNAQKRCFTKLYEQGKEDLKNKNYQKAFEHFIAARNCSDLPLFNNDLDLYIDSTSNSWTKDLSDALDKSKNLADTLSKSRDSILIEKKKVERSDVINKSYRSVYESQNELGKGKAENAVQLAFDARYIINEYNQDTSNIGNEIDIPNFAIEAFGNAVFAKDKNVRKTGHQEVLDFGMADSGDRFYTIGRYTGLKIWNTESDSLFCFSMKSAQGKNKPDYIISASFSKNGRKLIACHKNKISKIWIEGKHSPILLEHDETIVQGAFVMVNNEENIVTIDKKGAIQLWNISGQKLMEKLLQSESLLDFKIDGELAFVRAAHQVFKVNLNSFNWKKTIDSDFYIFDIELSPDARQLLIVSSGQNTRLVSYDLKEETTINSDLILLSASYNKLNKQFVVGARNGTICFINEKGDLKKKPFKLDSMVKGISISSNNHYMLAFASDSVFVEGSSLRYLNSGAQIASAVFDSQSEMVLTSAENGLTKLWTKKGGAVMNMPMKNPVFKAVFAEQDEKVVGITTGGTFFITPTPELVYQNIEKREKK